MVFPSRDVLTPSERWAPERRGRFRLESGKAILVGACRVLGSVLALVGVVLLVLMFTPLPDRLVEPLLLPRDLRQSDAIVLLAAWASPDGVLNDPGIRRTIAAAQLYKSAIAPAVVVSGRNPSADSGPTSQIMADFLVELGVPRAVLTVETASTNTHETAVNVSKLASERGWIRLTLVSDARDMRRATASFRHEGMDVVSGVGWERDLRNPPGPYRLWQFEGTLHEWGGLAYYWWNGWI